MKTFGVKIKSELAQSDKNLVVRLENKQELFKWITLLKIFQCGEKISYISYEELGARENNFIEVG